MDEPSEWLTREQLGERLRASIPSGMDPDQVLAGVLLTLKDPGERTRPIAHQIGKPVIYAWHESDASATNTALDVLAQLGLSTLLGPAGIGNLGVALKELVSFLVKLHRHRVRVSDPVEVSVVLLLHDAGSGLTSWEIRQRLVRAHGAQVAPSLADVESALERLANASARTGPKALVRADAQVWKSLV